MNTLEMKLHSITSTQNRSYDQPHTDQLKRTPLKTPEESTYASQFTKRMSTLTLHYGTIIKINKWWDSIRCAYCQSLSTNNRRKHKNYSKKMTPIYLNMENIIRLT